MTGRLVEARADLVLDPANLERLFSAGPSKEVTVPGLAAAIHGAFCEPRGFGDLAGEVHERMHREIAAAVFERL